MQKEFIKMIIAPIFSRLNNLPQIRQDNTHVDNRIIKPNYANQLSRDTVSFTSAKFAVGVKDFYTKEYPRYRRIATTYLDATAAVARKLKDDGVWFVREMFESQAVKTPDSQVTKIKRRKTFERRDIIRTTIFMKNPYDLSILFDKIIPEYEQRGYHVAGTKGYELSGVKTSIGDLMKRGYVPVEEERLISEFFNIPHTQESHTKYYRELRKLGYDYDDTRKIFLEYLKGNKRPTKAEYINIAKTLKKYMPDIDVRLNGKILNREYDTSRLPEEYQYCVGKPHGNYEDVQLRFVRECDKENSNPVFHELLIHFGPVYNKNAIAEHNYIYEPLRLFDELNILSQDTPFNSPGAKAIGYIEAIQNMFRNTVSTKLIEQGKNVDYYGINDELEIVFSQSAIVQNNNNFILLRELLDEHYTRLKNSVKVVPMLYNQAKRDHIADKKLIKKIEDDLVKTIKYFNHLFGLKDTGKVKPGEV